MWTLSPFSWTTLATTVASTLLPCLATLLVATSAQAGAPSGGPGASPGPTGGPGSAHAPDPARSPQGAGQPPSASRPGSFRVTVGQVRLTTPQGVLRQARQAFSADPKAELVVLPEFSTHGDQVQLTGVGYLKKDLEARRTAEKWIQLTPTFSQVQALARQYKKAMVVGCLEQEKGRLYSRAYFFDPKTNQLLHYDKTHVHWTEHFLRPGKELRPLDTRFGRLGVLICYDLAFVEPTRVLGLQGADLLVVISAIPQHFHWKYPFRRMVGSAIFNQYHVVAANLGHSPRSPMGGHSAIFDAEANTLAHLKHKGAGQITATVNLSAQKQWQKKEVIEPYRHPELYQNLAAPKKKVEPK